MESSASSIDYNLPQPVRLLDFTDDLLDCILEGLNDDPRGVYTTHYKGILGLACTC